MNEWINRFVQLSFGLVCAPFRRKACSPHIISELDVRRTNHWPEANEQRNTKLDPSVIEFACQSTRPWIFLFFAHIRIRRRPLPKQFVRSSCHQPKLNSIVLTERFIVTAFEVTRLLWNKRENPLNTRLKFSMVGLS